MSVTLASQSKVKLKALSEIFCEIKTFKCETIYIQPLGSKQAKECILKRILTTKGEKIIAIENYLVKKGEKVFDRCIIAIQYNGKTNFYKSPLMVEIPEKYVVEFGLKSWFDSENKLEKTFGELLSEKYGCDKNDWFTFVCVDFSRKKQIINAFINPDIKRIMYA